MYFTDLSEELKQKIIDKYTIHKIKKADLRKEYGYSQKICQKIFKEIPNNKEISDDAISTIAKFPFLIDAIVIGNSSNSLDLDIQTGRSRILVLCFNVLRSLSSPTTIQLACYTFDARRFVSTSISVIAETRHLKIYFHHHIHMS